MDFQVANRISGVHGSMIRELFKLRADPNTISFGAATRHPRPFRAKRSKPSRRTF